MSAADERMSAVGPGGDLSPLLAVGAQAPVVRLLVLSDLHLEFGSFVPPPREEYDIVVLAGDISNGVKSVHWAQRHSTFGLKPVVLIAGNHEFYGSERNKMLSSLRGAASGSNVHFLDCDEVVLSAVRFLGTTLWTDFALDVQRGTEVSEAMRAGALGLNDFRAIREATPTDLHHGQRRRFTPERSAALHHRSRTWLLERIEAPTRLPTVIVTHHAPSSRSMDPVWEGNDLNPCFYSDLPDKFFQSAKLWIHGHTHSSSDYTIDATRVVANPRGYVNRRGDVENKRFKANLVIEVVGGTE